MVDYSTKHHPQDSRLPGYQHLARSSNQEITIIAVQDRSVHKAVSGKRAADRAKRPSHEEDKDMGSGIVSPARPRKKLRTTVVLNTKSWTQW